MTVSSGREKKPSAFRDPATVTRTRSNDDLVVESWHLNASPWTTAVRGNQIESRTLVTNQAIVDAVLSRSPASVLDIGCGEGWLVRALAEHGVSAICVAVVPALIDQANKAGGGEFRIASYEAIASGALEVSVDVAVANFSLTGKEVVENLIGHALQLLHTRGVLITQTIQPVTACGERPYEDG